MLAMDSITYHSLTIRSSSQRIAISPRGEGKVLKSPFHAPSGCIEAAAQAWVIVSSVDDWIARQSSLVTKKRTVLPVVAQRMQIAEGLARTLERLGPERRAREVPSLRNTCARRRGVKVAPRSTPKTGQ